jgi:23S rRNA (pseudouridine1915-N3)-methyltransferase
LSRELVIAWAGRHQRRAWDDLAADYRRRMERFLPVRDLVVKAKATGDGAERKRAEGRALLAALPERSWTVALDPGGELLSSEALAARLARLRRDWPHAIAFVVGSDLGLDGEVLAAARQSISLGPLTLPHELARVVLYEQLYRALCIDAGINYHRV